MQQQQWCGLAFTHQHNASPRALLLLACPRFASNTPPGSEQDRSGFTQLAGPCIVSGVPMCERRWSGERSHSARHGSFS